jgi:uncharacterized protein
MNLKRRDLLLFLASASTLAALGCQSLLTKKDPIPHKSGNVGFKTVKSPIPLATDGIPVNEQIQAYSTYEIVDDLVLPEGFTYDVIAAWGDRVGDSHFGYNNDYLALVETDKNQAYLTVNFEYISPVPWLATYQQVIGKSLPIKEIEAAVKSAGEKGINAYILPADDPLKAQIRELCQAALKDQGIGVIALRQAASGKWERTNGGAERRINGLSGLEDRRYLQVTGPGAAVFRKQQGQGYIDKLGDRIIGTFGNCAGGTTPWGTVISAEENFQTQVPEAVYPDGTAFDPKECPFQLDQEELSGQGNVFGLAGNKYGWIVEIDPANPEDYGTKHTWLGRYRHEAVAVKVVTGKPMAVYSGCDRRGGHLYKFVSQATVVNPQDKANSRLFQQGILYAAKFHPDGSGEWLPLTPQTPVKPELPSNLVREELLLPKRPTGGYFKVTQEQEVLEFQKKFPTLDALYTGNAEEKQGAILIDAHYAANAIGATSAARPEDVELNFDGSLYITFTSGTGGSDGSPDKRVFKGPQGETPYEYGWIARIEEEKGEPAATRFRWQIFATGGEPAEGGLGFANPDNLCIDHQGNFWMANDMSTSKQNKAVTSRMGKDGKKVSQPNLLGLFGNNGLWFLPAGADNPKGKAYLFGIGPMECETTGPFLSNDQKTLFLSVQHPGETNGMRQNQATETRKFLLKTTDGQEFWQTRQIPIGSNWPRKLPNSPPQPAVVAIRLAYPS